MNVIKEIIKNLRYLEQIDINQLPLSNSFKTFLKSEVQYFGNDLESLKSEVLRCCKCPLHRVRKEVIWGEGPTDSALMIISEYPDRDEDFYGKPFVGETGNLLDRMLMAINLSRKRFFITHAVKCKTPGGRPPETEEIEACKSFLIKQIKIMKPKLILALGFTPPKPLLGVHSFPQVRGKTFKIKESVLFFTYHPSYILKNPGIKREVWEDLQSFKALYEKMFSSD